MCGLSHAHFLSRPGGDEELTPHFSEVEDARRELDRVTDLLAFILNDVVVVSHRDLAHCPLFSVESPFC